MGMVGGHLGLDLGGTKMEAVALSPGFQTRDDPTALVRARLRRPTEAHGGYDHILSRAASLLQEVRSEAGMLASPVSIGVGLPGHISPHTGLVKNANTTCLNGRPALRDLVQRLGQPAVAANDANLFALAEATWGAGAGVGAVFGVILGTGVGGGIVIGGQLIVGREGIAGEWGHTRLEAGGRPCYCGHRGCVETYLSGPGLAQSLSEAGRPMSAQAFDQLWRSGGVQGDEALNTVATSYLRRFGRGLATVVNVFDPDVIILGGGMGRWPALYTQGPEAILAHTFGGEAPPPLRPPKLGDAAGVFGAALLGQRGGAPVA